MLMHRSLSALVVTLFFTVGCSSDEEPVCEGDQRILQKVYYGTSSPTYVPLSPGQILAIGDLGGCSGTLVAPTWVLSAKHCGLFAGAKFCLGEQSSRPAACLNVLRVLEHPDAGNDLAVAELDVDARVLVPEVQPIPIMTALMDKENEWIGQMAEAAGYGLTETGGVGTRYFTAEPIVDFAGNLMTVDGQGMHGLCNGDSGGPVMVIATDGTVRVAGALYGGDASCVGRDSYTRTDLFKDWIEGYTGPTSVDPSGCGSFDAVGGCAGNTARWCEGEELRAEECPAGTACGWDEAVAGFRCIAGDDPCLGYDRRGGCDNNVARWCEDGQPRSLDCSGCGFVCNPYAGLDGAYCQYDPCMGLDYLGRCNGTVAEWCENGEVESYDCAMDGDTCGYVDENIGYYCMGSAAR